MRRFARLYDELDASTATLDKVAALRCYFADAPAADAAWAVYFLCGGKPRQVVPTAVLRAAACRCAGIDDWLFDECYQAVGDLAETIALVLPPGGGGSLESGLESEPGSGLSGAPSKGLGSSLSGGLGGGCSESGLAVWVEQRLLTLRGLAAVEQGERLIAAWGELDAGGRFLLVKLIGGGFRVGVSRLLVQRALAEHAGLDNKLLAQRLVGWTEARATPDSGRYLALLAAPGEGRAPAGQPYPFFLAHALQAAPESLGPRQDWLAEWKYDGVRAQVVKRAGEAWIWSRGEELVTDRFPEVVARAAALRDGTVLDGELLVWPAGAERPAPFKLLQTRMARKTLGRKLLADAPVALVAYDLLELGGDDLRALPQQVRRQRLEFLLESGPFRISPLLAAPDWPGLAELRRQARERGVEGLMLKRADSGYGSGRTKAEGLWWKWKTDPLSVDAVLIYAQAGHGRRASVYTDYTFAVWSRPPADAAEAQAVVEAIARRDPAPDRASGALQLLPFAKAYSGLSDDEFKAVDREIRAHTLEKFGPVRSVRPTLVFEIGFEGIAASPRHKSGVAVRFPRMLRIRHDKALWQADSLGALVGMMVGEVAIEGH